MSERNERIIIAVNGAEGRWQDVGAADEVARRKRFVVTDGDEEIVIIAHGGGVYAMANKCIHRQRELVKGVVLRDRLVCPGHQWAFALDTGWESVKEECQPTYAVRVTDGGRVEVDLDSKARRAPIGGDWSALVSESATADNQIDG